MLFKTLKFVSLMLLFIGFYFSSDAAMATTAQEYCEVHKTSGAPGTCTVCGECAVLTTNLGTHETKLCGEGGCELTDAANCPDYPACVE